VSDRKPLVTVVSVVKNDAPGLLATLRSVDGQRWRDFEHVVVDGASRDDSIGVLRRHEHDRRRWSSEPDAGISDAFNKGLRLAHGAYINFLNAGDTFVDDTALERVAPRLTGAAIVTGYSRIGSGRLPPYPVGNHDRLPRRALISHQASFVHRRVFDACGEFDLRFAARMDYEFWLRALARFELEFVDEVLTDFVPGGASSDFRRFFAEECAANLLHLRHARLENLRVRGRRVLYLALGRAGLLEVYRAFRLRKAPR
jgi:glycosyltransferase involved in cell wall biosynthesis